MWEFPLRERAPFVRLRRGKPPTFPVFTKRRFRFATLNLPESISQSARLAAISLVSLASFLPASASHYSGGKSAAIPTGSLLLFPNSCQLTYFCMFPNSDLKATLIPQTEGSSYAHLYHNTSKQQTDYSTRTGRPPCPEAFNVQSSYKVNSISLPTLSESKRPVFVQIFSIPKHREI